jgi:hypothetical protein
MRRVHCSGLLRYARNDDEGMGRMKLGRLNHMCIATPSIADAHSVIASEAKQPSAVGATMDCFAMPAMMLEGRK